MRERRTTSLDAPTLARIRDVTTREATYLADMQQQRDYAAGRQFIALTDRLRQFLGGNTSLTTEDFKRIRLNIFRTVINAVVERLIVSKIATDEIARPAPLKDALGQAIIGEDGTPQIGQIKPQANWAGRTWLHNRMDARQRTIYDATLRDSESFVLVVWDADSQVARFTLHPRYIPATLSRTPALVDTLAGYGCQAFYRNNDPEQPLEFVTKHWTETSYVSGSAVSRDRLTIYYPDRIEKYAGGYEVWSAVQDAGDSAWPLPWRDPRTGAPLGIPVVHFRSTFGFEAGEAIGPQNALNKTLIDLLAAADLTAFQILIALGWQPIDASGQPLPIEPGTWVGTSSTDAKVQVVPPADLGNLSDQVYNWILWCAMATDTPVARFSTTKQLAAEGTQKQQDGPLLHKIRMRQSELSIGVADLFVVARTLHNAFFSAPRLDDNVVVTAEWEPIETRDEDAELARAVIKADKLSIPLAQVWSELGYTEVQIAQWEALRAAEAQRQQEQQQQRLEAMQAQADGQGQDGQGQPNQNGKLPQDVTP